MATQWIASTKLSIERPNGSIFPGSESVSSCILLLAVLFGCAHISAVASQVLDADFKSAEAAHARADYAHSIPALRTVLRRTPRSYAANLLLGEDLFKTGKFKDAMGPLETASEVRPEDGVAEVFLAQAAAGLNDFPKASEALLTALRRSKASAPFLKAWAAYCLDRVQAIGPDLRGTKGGEAVVLRIEAALRPEGTELRRKLLAQSAAEDPGQHGIWGELGTAELELGHHDRAMEDVTNAQTREPGANGTLELEGLLAATAQDWATAEARFTALAGRSPAEFRNAVNLWLHVLAPRQEITPPVWPCLSGQPSACPATLTRPQGGEGESAGELYTQERWEQLAALPRPASMGGLEDLWRGVALAQLGQCLSAIPLLEYGMKADERAAGFWLDICYANQGNAALARLRKEGDNVAVEQIEGDIQLQLHDDAAAAQIHYAAALKSDPQNAHLLERSAEAALRLGDTDEAQRSALAALVLDPHNAFAVKTLATLAVDNRDYAEALVRLRELARMEPQDHWTRVELGVSYAQLGDAARAMPYLQQELSAGYPDAKGGLHAQLATVLRKLGKADQARQASAEAKRLANLSFQSVSTESPHAPQ